MFTNLWGQVRDRLRRTRSSCQPPSRRRGTAAMEFALCLPVTMLVFGSVVDGGRVMSVNHSLARAARDGARIGSMVMEPPPATGHTIRAEARAAAERSLLAAGHAPGEYFVTASWDRDADDIAWIRVTVTSDFQPIFRGLSPFQGPVTHEFFMITQEQ